MKIAHIVGIAAAGVACAATGGLAAPAIGAAIGGTMGLSGAAATSAGLAALGGGSLAAGGAGMAGGTLLIQAALAGTGMLAATGIISIPALRKKDEEINKLKKELEKNNLDSAKKQKIIKNLAKQNDQLKRELELEKKKNKSNAEKINLLEKMIRNINSI